MINLNQKYLIALSTLRIESAVAPHTKFLQQNHKIFWTRCDW